MDDSPFPQHDVAHDAGSRQAQEHGRHARPEIRRRVRRRGAACEEGRHRVWIAVEDAQAISRVDQAHGHSGAHVSESDEAEH